MCSTSLSAALRISGDSLLRSLFHHRYATTAETLTVNQDGRTANPLDGGGPASLLCVSIKAAKWRFQRLPMIAIISSRSIRVSACSGMGVEPDIDVETELMAGVSGQQRAAARLRHVADKEPASRFAPPSRTAVR
jgi:hypothetical protein